MGLLYGRRGGGSSGGPEGMRLFPISVGTILCPTETDGKRIFEEIGKTSFEREIYIDELDLFLQVNLLE